MLKQKSLFVSILPYVSVTMLRFLGLFVILPVISLLVSVMPGSNIFTVAATLGAPYLFQIIFQPIFGRLSDKFARKTIILIGLFIFFIGSLICVFADSIYHLILGRSVQGIGAIGGVLTALIADSVREEKRIKAMSIMGIGVFISFIVAMFVGSIVGMYYGLSYLFLLTVIFALIAILVTIFFIKNVSKPKYFYPSISLESAFKKAIYISSISIFIQKFLMFLTFIIAPIILRNFLNGEYFYMIYLPAVLIGALGLGPSSVLSEKRGKSKEVFIFSIIFFMFTYLFMFFSFDSLIIFTIALSLFFISFSIQEALLQGLVSKYAKASIRGKVLGDFNSYGFAGSLLGSIVGGFFSSNEHLYGYASYLFSFLIILCLIWATIVYKFILTPKNKIIYFDTILIKNKNFMILNDVEGIYEWYENKLDNVLVIKFDFTLTNEDAIKIKLGI